MTRRARYTDHPPERILLICPSWVGDTVMAHSLIQRLAARWPGVQLDALALPWVQPLLERMPEIREVLPMPVGHGRLQLGARWTLARQLRNRHYDQAVVLPNSWKSALIPWLAGISRRTGWRGEWRHGLLNDLRLLDRRRLPMTVQRYAALASDSSEPWDPVDFPRPRLAIDRGRASAGVEITDGLVLALCPGAEFGWAKCWPMARYAALAKAWLEQETTAANQVWLFGSDADRPLCERINARAGGRCLNLAGRTTLAQAMDRLALAQVVVTNDSGLMHVAAALDRPLVALFGPTSALATPPLSERARLLQVNLDCRPCGQRSCPLGTHACMEGLGVDQVLAAIDGLLVDKAGPADDSIIPPVVRADQREPVAVRKHDH